MPVEEGTETTETTETVETAAVETADDSAAPGVAETVEEAVEDFDWASWDGSVDSLPGDHKYGQQMYDYYQVMLKNAQRSSEDYDELYKRLINDPEAKEEIERLRHEKVEMQEAMEARIKADADAYAAWFRRAYDWVFENDAIKARVSELVGLGWSPEGAADMTKFSEDAQKEALEAREDGASENYALRVAAKVARVEELETAAKAAAESSKKKTPPKKVEEASPPRSSEVVRGSSPSRKPLAPKKKSVRETASLDEARALVLEGLF